MATDYFRKELAINEITGSTVPSAVALVYAITDTTFATPLAITDMSDVPMSNLTASPTGIYPEFKCPGHTQVNAVSGEVVTPITSLMGALLDLIPDPATGDDLDVIAVVGGEYVLTVQSGGGGGGSGNQLWVESLDDIPPGTPVDTLVIVRNA